MQYGGPFDLITLVMALAFVLEWGLPVAIVLVITGWFKKSRRALCLKLALAWVVIVFVIAEVGLYQCNTSYSCALDSVPSLIFQYQ